MAWHRWDPVFYSSAKLLDLNNLGRMWFSFKSNEYTKSNWRQSRCKCTENVCHLPNGQVWFMTWSPECRKSRIDLRAHAFRKQIRRKLQNQLHQINGNLVLKWMNAAVDHWKRRRLMGVICVSLLTTFKTLT